MSKLAATVICLLPFAALNGCTADAPAPATPPPSQATSTIAKTGKKASKKFRPKTEAFTKHENTVRPFAD